METNLFPFEYQEIVLPFSFLHLNLEAKCVNLKLRKNESNNWQKYDQLHASHI
jgi:hypothetical protein